MSEKIIYFSLKEKRMSSFVKYVEKELRFEPYYTFDIIGKENGFKNPRELIPLIDGTIKENPSDNIHVIIDYISCCDVNQMDNYPKVIRDIIMCYPEVQFLFDETFVNKAKEDGSQLRGLDFMTFLFKGLPPENIKVQSEYHKFQIYLEDKEKTKREFILTLKGRNNIYDASNLRCAIKKTKYDELHVYENYRKVQESRRDNLAVSIDEEYHQNAFNAYCLYANGFRVKPVATLTELVALRTMQQVPSIVIRDYDLQFIDENNKYDDSDNLFDNKLNRIDSIRGAKYNEGDSEWLLIDPFWKIFKGKGIKFYYISKGGDNIRIRLKKNLELGRNINKNKKILILNGLEKPISGIYKSLHQMPEIKERYEATRYKQRDEQFPLKLKRKDSNGHSCPLNIYGIARLMIHRAKMYNSKEKYRLAAVVSGEALEVLNGFHESLVLKAYYYQAVSENAMAMQLLGGDEQSLVNDTAFRMTKIKEDVERMIPQWNKRYNMLYNIYNDCRHLCVEKEHFQSADEILSKMVRIGHHKFLGLAKESLLKMFCSICSKRKSKNQSNNK